MGTYVAVLTVAHTLISLVGIATGFIAYAGFFASRPPNRWTAIFLATTVATSVTGWFFPFRGFLPSHGVSVVSLLVLPVAIVSLYHRRLAGLWRPVYVITASLALYLNVFVLIAQLYLKVPALNALAPTQSEAPFIATQSIVLAIFLTATIIATVRFHPERRG